MIVETEKGRRTPEQTRQAIQELFGDNHKINAIDLGSDKLTAFRRKTGKATFIVTAPDTGSNTVDIVNPDGTPGKHTHEALRDGAFMGREQEFSSQERIDYLLDHALQAAKSGGQEPPAEPSSQA